MQNNIINEINEILYSEFLIYLSTKSSLRDTLSSSLNINERFIFEEKLLKIQQHIIKQDNNLDLSDLYNTLTKFLVFIKDYKDIKSNYIICDANEGKNSYNSNSYYQVNIEENNISILDNNFKVWIENKFNSIDFDKEKLDYLKEIEELKKQNKELQENQFTLEYNNDKINKKERFSFDSELSYLIISYQINKQLFKNFNNVDIWDDPKKEKQLASNIKKYDYIILDTRNIKHSVSNIVKKERGNDYLRLNSLNELNLLIETDLSEDII